jgi:hypothetical protein
MLGIWVIALVVRVTVFASGGAGAWFCVIAFWAATVALLAISIQHLRRAPEGGKTRYILVVIGLLAFGYRVIVPNGILADLSTIVWLACALGLLAGYIRAAIHHRGHAASY